MGPASDLRQKECPRLLSRARSPSSAPHSRQRWGPLCSPFRAQTPEQRPQTSTQQHLAAPAAALFTIISLFLQVQASPTFSGGFFVLFFFFFEGGALLIVLPQSCSPPHPPPPLHATKMLIALQSQSLKSLTYCVDNIPRPLRPFMWVLMYCHLPAL